MYMYIFPFMGVCEVAVPYDMERGPMPSGTASPVVTDSDTAQWLRFRPRYCCATRPESHSCLRSTYSGVSHRGGYDGDYRHGGWRGHAVRRTIPSMHERIMFAGLDKARTVPKGYNRLMGRHDVDADPWAFTDVLEHFQDQYSIEWRNLYYNEYPDDHPDDVVPAEVSHYKALVNPAWVGEPTENLPGDRQDAIWHIPTKKYTKATPDDLWRPLVKAIAKRGYHTDLFGSARVRRQGGEIHMDLFFKSAGLDSVADGEDITLGISTGHDYFGNTRLYVDVIAYHDTGDGVGQVMRYLVDPKRRKHTGEAGEEVVEWYGQGIERLDSVSSRIYGIVTDAMHYEIPVGDMACSIQGFYEHLGLPNRAPSELAKPAGERAVRTAVGGYTAWHMYKAGQWAIEHHYDSRDTSAFKKHVNTVNTLLFNPALAERQVLKSIEDTLESRPDDEHEIWDYIEGEKDRDSALEQVRTRAKSISEGVEEFESTRDRLRTMLQDEGTAEAVPDDDGDAETDADSESDVDAEADA